MKDKRKIIFTVLAIMLLVLGSVGYYYWYENEYYVSTEDAKVNADIVKIAPQISGKLAELDLKEGQTIVKDQIVGRQEMINLPDSSLELAVIRSPINGLVIKEQGTVGEVISPGQTLAMVIDPNKLYITANIEETRVERLAVGEKVDIVLDQYRDKKFTGKVETIGLAANSTFSMLPSSTSGNFTKVVQKIPVKISIDKTSTLIAPGTNAVIKIHVK